MAVKVSAAASDGQFWVSKVLNSIEQLGKDSKHVTLLIEADEGLEEIRQKARELTTRLGKVRVMSPRNSTSPDLQCLKWYSLLFRR